MVEVGSYVQYVDPHAQSHVALVTARWWEPENPTAARAINLVYVSGDESETDSYGRQIKRDTSVPHKEFQAAHGRYWYEF